jgi:hypothetical protein
MMKLFCFSGRLQSGDPVVTKEANQCLFGSLTSRDALFNLQAVTLPVCSGTSQQNVVFRSAKTP